MKLFISIICGLFNLTIITMMPMVGIFAAGAFMRNAAQSEQEIPLLMFPDVIMWISVGLAIAALAVHIYGQKLWWTDSWKGRRSKPIVLMLSGLPILAVYMFLIYFMFPR